MNHSSGNGFQTFFNAGGCEHFIVRLTSRCPESFRPGTGGEELNAVEVSPLLIEFHPDTRDKHVQESVPRISLTVDARFGTEIYTVVLEVSDMLQCGGITMPRKESKRFAGSCAHQDGSDLAYFLQMQTRSLSEMGALSSRIRTLNGQYFQKPEDLPLAISPLEWLAGAKRSLVCCLPLEGEGRSSRSHLTKKQMTKR